MSTGTGGPISFDHIVVVGAGGIGSRHLQGLSRATAETIVAVDPQPSSLEVARTRYDEVAGPDSAPLTTVTSIAEAAGEVGPGSFVVVATNADVRAAVTRDVVEHLEPTALLLEKVLFQADGDYPAIAGLLDARAVPAWVNHNFALAPVWHEVADRLAGSGRARVWVSGSGWGLACNTTHYLDAFFSGTPVESLTFDLSGLDPGSIPAKRPRYRELTGTIRVGDGRTELILTDSFPPSAPRNITIEHDGGRLLVEHRADGYDLWAASEATGWSYHLEDRFEPILQSRLTETVVADVAATGSCRLSTLAIAGPMHRAFVGAVAGHLAAAGELEEGAPCPIT